LLVAGLLPAAAGAPSGTGGGTQEVRAVDSAALQQVLHSLEGRVVVLNFWATWCEPCREEFPDLVKFAREHAGKVALVTVSLDDPDDAQKGVRAFLDKMNAPGTRLVKAPGDPDPFIRAVDPEWSGVLPATFVQAPDGSRAAAEHGPVTYAKLGEMTKSLLGGH
ncbi:MAG TPA: TlpA disulfide reductase family protein, partial [Candidatus Saccharimonadales bacterium]|nr:TlpA disulfide reductase family protein [Candidatus Saccharimonadales bacterium]